LHGHEFDLVTRRLNWGEDRVYYHDAKGSLASVPANYTNVDDSDPFVVISVGRSRFRYDDLLNLVRMTRHLSGKKKK
jgi:Family of unknown function (DUF5372)